MPASAPLQPRRRFAPAQPKRRAVRRRSALAADLLSCVSSPETANGIHIRGRAGMDAGGRYNPALPENYLTMQDTYDPRRVESEAQAFWEEKRSFQAEEVAGKPKFY